MVLLTLWTPIDSLLFGKIGKQQNKWCIITQAAMGGEAQWSPGELQGTQENNQKDKEVNKSRKKRNEDEDKEKSKTLSQRLLHYVAA